MAGTRRAFSVAMMVCALAAGALLQAGQTGQSGLPSQFPLSNTVRERGSSITGALEGWYFNKDGSVSILVGYFNRNTKQEFDIPVGPNNHIDPGGPDLGQPTHFGPGRQYGIFSIKVPKDFGQKKLSWTLTANGQTNVITLHTKAEYVVEPYEDAASKNTPPKMVFQPGGTIFTGPPSGLAATYTTTVSAPLTLTTWVTDEGPKVNVPEPSAARGRGRGRAGAADAGGRGAAGRGFTPPGLSVTWSLFRGPSAVTFDNAKPTVDKEHDGKATAVATFAAPGDYILRLQANDTTGEGGGGFQCCWSNVHVGVTVKP
jgi:hypothetical protein